MRLAALTRRAVLATSAATLTAMLDGTYWDKLSL